MPPPLPSPSPPLLPPTRRPGQRPLRRGDRAVRRQPARRRALLADRRDEAAVRGGHRQGPPSGQVEAASRRGVRRQCGAPSDHSVRVRTSRPGGRSTSTTSRARGSSRRQRRRSRHRSAASAGAPSRTGLHIQIDSTGDARREELIVDQDTARPPSRRSTRRGPGHRPVAPGEEHRRRGTTSVCAHDSYALHKCGRPHHLTSMADSTHTFRVRSMDAHGNLSPIVSAVGAWRPSREPRSGSSRRRRTATNDLPVRAAASAAARGR